MSEPVEALGRLRARVRHLTGVSEGAERPSTTSINGLLVMNSPYPTALTATVYNPIVCLILQGSKELAVGHRNILCQSGQSVVVSHDVPLASRIVEASPESPYLAVILQLDVATLRSLIVEAIQPDDDRTPASIQVGTADHDLLDAMDRLLKLSSEQDAAALSPLITREIHYRLVKGEHGAALSHVARSVGASAAITTSIARIRGNLAERLSIPDLAQDANMSPSTFHHHFKAITETTPLQYQKQLRLLEAQRLLAEEGQSVHQSARSVGYQSATQFSREYSRAFGTPPRNAKHATAVPAPAS